MTRYKKIVDIQQICVNGHQITDSYNNDPDSRKKFCPNCGERTINSCPICNTQIKGSESFFDTGYDAIVSSTPAAVPIFCESCGKPFPWAENISKENTILDSTARERSSNRKIFIVHGQNEEIKNNVEQFLKSLDLEPIILHKQADLGKTIIEKLEHCSDDVSFALILLDGDDIGMDVDLKNKEILKKAIDESGLSSITKENIGTLTEKQKMDAIIVGSILGTSFKNAKPRARQNVIFEFGYFIGLLERMNVRALYQEGVELPSDIHGMLYIPFDTEGIGREN